jgi:hypothetical protein
MFKSATSGREGLAERLAKRARLVGGELAKNQRHADS